MLAATNHENLLDAAVWRRFTYRVALQRPTAEQRARMWTDFVAPIVFSKRDLAVLADLSDGFSGSDVREACTRLRRRALTTGGKTVTLKDALPVVQNLAISGEAGDRFAATLAGKDTAAVVQVLRDRDAKLYSLTVVGDLFGLSKATAHRYSKNDEDPEDRADG